MTEEEKVAGFSPGAISSDNIEQVVAIGVAQMLKGGELIVNLGGIGVSNSMVVCALIEWACAARKKGCRVMFKNMSTSLERLLCLYQMGGVFTVVADDDAAL